MPLIKAFYLYLLTVPIFFAIDMVWLGLIAKELYKKKLGYILRAQVNWVAAIIFYLIFIVGIMIFAVLPALEKQRITQALLWGAVFGFFTYATYDLTNFATLKDWPLMIVFIDILWGMILCGTVATLSYLVARWLL